MVSSQLRANAREALKGKWGKAALLTLCYGLIMWVISFLLNLIPVVGSIISAVINVPISFGLLASFIKLKRDEEVGYTDFLSIAFSNFGKSWGVFGNIILKMIIPIILAVVFIVMAIAGTAGIYTSAVLLTNSNSTFTSLGGVAIIGFLGYFVTIIYATIKGYLYSLSYYILYDNPTKTGKEIVEMSETMMRGNRWSFFWLGLTFIGWAILSIFTLYIGLFWLIPYIMVTFVCFYESLSEKNSTVEVEKIEDTKVDDDPIKGE